MCAIITMLRAGDFDRMRSRKAALILAVTALFAVFCVAAAISGENTRLAVPHEGGQLPILSLAPSFSLTDTQGETFTDVDLAGKVWVALFSCMDCPDPDPTATQTGADLCRTLRSLDGVEFVSISADPVPDAPDVLAACAKEYVAGPGRWHFLTGPDETVRSLAFDGFGIAASEEALPQSPRLVLVDAYNRVRGYYDGTDQEDVAVLRRDINRLLASG